MISDRKTIDRGAELAAIGNCSDCHTRDVGVPYAGGRALPTPFGTIYASNLTPDLATGIGTWSEEAFRRAMHEGVDREGRQLYPAFPYDHFTKATDEDIQALYSFLMSIPAIRNVIPSNQLSFPFSFRPIIAGWKVLFLSQASLEKDTSKSVEWNRGRYLVEGLGHCGSCHTPRNALGGEKKGSPYAGGAAEGWNAPRSTRRLSLHITGPLISLPNICRPAGTSFMVPLLARWPTSPRISVKLRRTRFMPSLPTSQVYRRSQITGRP
jgi:mono/diheme cytochrome c family protein